MVISWWLNTLFTYTSQVIHGRKLQDSQSWYKENNKPQLTFCSMFPVTKSTRSSKHSGVTVVAIWEVCTVQKYQHAWMLRCKYVFSFVYTEGFCASIICCPCSALVNATRPKGRQGAHFSEPPYCYFTFYRRWKWYFAELCYHTAFNDAVATLVSLAPHMSVIPPLCCDGYYDIKMYEIKGNFLHTVCCKCGVSLESWWGDDR